MALHIKCFSFASVIILELSHMFFLLFSKSYLKRQNDAGRKNPDLRIRKWLDRILFPFSREQNVVSSFSCRPFKEIKIFWNWCYFCIFNWGRSWLISNLEIKQFMFLVLNNFLLLIIIYHCLEVQFCFSAEL